MTEDPVHTSGTGGFAWFPKRMQEGDMRAAAEKRLLQGELEAEEVLVRELAQNSWDARESHVRTVEFELRVRRLAPALRREDRRI